jgi:hypothetical protein
LQTCEVHWQASLTRSNRIPDPRPLSGLHPAERKS